MAKLAPAVRTWLNTAGAAGPTGDPGAPGAIDLNRISAVEGPQTGVPNNIVTTVSAACPAGHRVVGGGYSAGAAQPVGSFPSSPERWAVRVRNESGAATMVNAVAICVAP